MSGQRKITGKIDFKTFVDTFNTLGKQAAVQYVKDTYDVQYNTIVKRLRKESQYEYNQQRDRYVLKSECSAENPFLTVDELCNTEKAKVQHTLIIDASELISDLIKDKFFEISKYVTLENSSRKITLKLNAARKAGYDIEYV